MDRQSIIKKLSPAIEKATGKTADQVVRDLASASIQELEAMLNRQIQRGLITPEPEPTPAPLVDKDAIQKDIQDLEAILASRQGIAEAQVGREADLAEFQASIPVKEPDKRQLEFDRQTFSRFAREFGLSECQANFCLSQEILRDNFTQFSLTQAVRDGRLDLAPATPEELKKYREDAEAARRDYLINHASPEELRRTAAYESQQRRIQAQREEDQRQLAAREAKDRGNFPPLPEKTADGTQQLDSKFFVRISNSDLGKFKNFIKKYGAFQITKALRERV